MHPLARLGNAHASEANAAHAHASEANAAAHAHARKPNMPKLAMPIASDANMLMQASLTMPILMLGSLPCPS